MSGCAAPSIQLRFDPNGLVTSCCKSTQPLGHIAHQRLPDIWDGVIRHRLVDALAVGDFSEGCHRCEAEIAQEGREVSYAAIHDQWASHLGRADAARWPVRMEFNLSNACNLECIQCDGDSSSAIRARREGRPPLPKVYDDQFFDDLRVFVPHLERVVFGGGEPFLAPENFRVMELIAESGADVDCVVVTNATQLTPRIESLMERLPLSFIFSVDGATAPTYESIRIGAHFDSVMQNIDRFCAHVRERGTTASVNHCLMPTNVHEFPEMLLWAERRGLFVNVSVVRAPASASIARLEPSELSNIVADLAARDVEVRSALSINRPTWDAELHRLRTWTSNAPDRRPSSRMVMWFRCDGEGAHDDRDVVADLLAWSGSELAESITVGWDDVIRSSRVSVAGPGALEGESVHQFTKALVSRYGEMNDYSVMSTSADVVVAEATFGATPARIVTAALRDESGWADTATVNVAFADAPSSRRSFVRDIDRVSDEQVAP